MHIILVPAISGLITYGVIPGFLKLLKIGGATRSNYRGDIVPIGVGFVFIWVGCISALLLLLPSLLWSDHFGLLMRPTFLSIIMFGITALGYGFLGLFDDFVGCRHDTGLRGHGAALRQGRLTSGAVKALVGVAFGMAIAGYRLGVGGSFPQEWPLLLCIDGLLIAAWANTLNLFDLRPGRAGKAFLFSCLVLILAGNPVSLILLPWIGGLLGYLPFDLRGEAMMGDVGANALGALVGLASCYGLSLSAKSVLVSGLVFLHILAELVSFSELIENHPLLKTLDSWGRKDP